MPRGANIGCIFSAKERREMPFGVELRDCPPIFELDSSRKMLVLGAERVDVSIRGLEVLLVLVAHAASSCRKRHSSKPCQRG
jgi:hypothetical protein